MNPKIPSDAEFATTTSSWASHARRLGDFGAQATRVTYARVGLEDIREVKVVLHKEQEPQPNSHPGRPERRDNGRRAFLEQSSEGRATLVEAKRKLGNILAADGLVPLAALRLQRGLSQQQLSDLTGIQQPQLSRIESGLHDIKATTAEKLAKALGVSVAAVIDAVLKMRPKAGNEDV